MNVHAARPLSYKRRVINITESLFPVAFVSASCYAVGMGADIKRTADNRDAVELIERVRRQAYADGYRAALAEVQRHAAEMSDADVISLGTSFVPAGVGGPGAPKQGTVPRHVLELVTAQQAMTTAEIINALKAAGHTFSEASVRMSLSRLSERKFIVAHHKKWFLTKAKEAPAEAFCHYGN